MADAFKHVINAETLLDDGMVDFSKSKGLARCALTVIQEFRRRANCLEDQIYNKLNIRMQETHSRIEFLILADTGFGERGRHHETVWVLNQSSPKVIIISSKDQYKQFRCETKQYMADRDIKRYRQTKNIAGHSPYTRTSDFPDNNKKSKQQKRLKSSR